MNEDRTLLPPSPHEGWRLSDTLGAAALLALNALFVGTIVFVVGALLG